MKEMIVEQLKSRVGLSQEQATKAAEVVVEIVESKGGELKDKLGGLGDMAGGLLGGKKD